MALGCIIVCLCLHALNEDCDTIKQHKCVAWLQMSLRGGRLCHVTFYCIYLWQYTIIRSNTYVLVEGCKGNSYQTDDKSKTDCTEECQHSNIYRPPRPRRTFSRDWTSNGKLLLSRDRRQEVQAWESPSLPIRWSSNIPVSAKVQLILLVWNNNIRIWNAWIHNTLQATNTTSSRRISPSLATPATQYKDTPSASLILLGGCASNECWRTH